jgi:hypothetical protein
MTAAELTLSAALRDVRHSRPDIRSVAIRSLAPALLDEIGLRPPTWRARIEHERLADVIEALDQACADPAPQNAGLARLGLASLAAPQAYARAQEALATEGDDEPAKFLRECGVIALSLIGGAARGFLAEPPEPTGGDEAEDAETEAEAEAEARTEAATLRDRILAELLALIDDPRDDLRFQIGPALVEVGGTQVEHELLAALDREQHPDVRENLIAAISMLDDPSPATYDALAAVLDTEQGEGQVGWEAALVLTAARRPEGAARLLDGLRSRTTRDTALEALAVLGERAGPNAPAAVRRYTRGLLTPVFTKVRAAYALARMVPAEGSALLDRLAKHPRPAVREAVAEARRHLADLAAEGDATDRSAYRRKSG